MATRLLVLGLVLFFQGLQLRSIESFVLNERASRFVAERLKSKDGAGDGLYPPLVASTGYDAYLLASLPGLAAHTPRKTIEPPKWVAWSLMSVGAVLALSYPCYRK